MELAVADFWWLERGIPPHVADEMPAGRAQWLRAVAEIVDESRAKNSPAAKANEEAEHQQRLAEAKLKAGLV